MIYLDNAATYHPKSPRIAGAISNYLETVIASPGRSSHKLSRQADEILNSARLRAQTLFSADSFEKFHFCANATHGLNFIIQGLLQDGDHVVTTSLEHNSVLRPLKKMMVERKVQVDIVPCNAYGEIDPLEVLKGIRANTKLVVLNHASNVVGTVLDLQPIIEWCADHGILTLVDASQTAGFIPLNLQRTPIDFLVATGHKALRGPSGTALIYTRTIDKLKPVVVGGTGGNSLSLHHPQNMQTILEAGTPNYLGIAGLGAALSDVIENPVDSEAELRLARYLAYRLNSIGGVTTYGPRNWNSRVPIVSFNLSEFTPQSALAILDDDFQIAVRAGLHCAPIAHQMIGTAPNGTVRASLSHASTLQEIDALVCAVADMAHSVARIAR